ncbi:hypothetical protein [Chitinophaga sp. CF118]|uniref:hypothetical protein n=1 Tax=Chitinophaga sp. CF118 TaxID=1884367 RepID=UPI000B7F217F|nr:hypothetical protein [Chitinophaga sp. CF118]
MIKVLIFTPEYYFCTHNHADLVDGCRIISEGIGSRHHKVKLEGKAMFDVTPGAVHPFIVQLYWVGGNRPLLWENWFEMYWK